MSISNIQTYRYQDSLATAIPTVFEVESIRLENSCTTNKSHRSAYYKILFVAEGNGSYQVDFQQFNVEGAGIFFLSPGQVFTVESESMKTGYQISFNREF